MTDEERLYEESLLSEWKQTQTIFVSKKIVEII